MRKIKVLILCGGISNERDVSILSGENIEKSLDRNKFIISKVLINSNNVWEKTVAKQKIKYNPVSCLEKEKPNVIFLALHGKDGEDGKIQSLCEMFKIPYTGSGVLASALAMNKEMSYNILSSKLLSPNFFRLDRKSFSVFKKDTLVKKIKKDISFPCIIKPNESGSSVGISKVNTFQEISLALQKAFKEDDKILIQEYIQGKEFTCAVLGNSSIGGELISLPVVQIIPKSEFFDRDAKYSGQTGEICPANISKNLENKIREMAIIAHKSIMCDGLTRTDFIYTDNKLYFLEINTIPGATSESLAPKEAKAHGWSYSKFLEMQINLAISKNKI